MDELAKQPENHIELHNVALDIELILVSVIQGVALTFLGTSALDPITHFDISTWLYIVSAFLILLIFWSQAILHATSFIHWPLDLGRMFLYFLVSFCQILLFSQVTRPLYWFGFSTVFMLVAFVLYIYDYIYLQQSGTHFQATKDKRKLYQHILFRQTYELRSFLPLGIAFNFISFCSIWLYPNAFLQHGYHLLLISLQVIFSLIALQDFARHYQLRTELIAKAR